MRPALTFVRSALASLIVVSVGCGGAEAPPPPLEAYFAATPYRTAACNVVDQRLTGQREVHLFTNGDVDLLPITQGLASYYHRHSLTFVTPEQPEETPMSYAVDTDPKGLTQGLLKAFPGVDFSNDEALMADPVLWARIQGFYANYYFRPLIEFATTHAVGPDVTNLLLIPDIERPDGTSLAAPGTAIAGLSVSPALLAEFARMMAPDNEAWKYVNLPTGFTPMVLLGSKVLESVNREAPVLKDLTTAHEFGHSAGLVHSDVERNLMYPVSTPGVNDCTDSLTDEQLDLMRTTLHLATAASETPAPTGDHVARFRASFTPAHARALLAGDRQATRSFVDLLLGRDGV